MKSRLVSELEAGWYRYVSKWHLHADGTICPRFGCGAVDNSCGATPITHHVYWRLDFDISGAADDVVAEHDDPPLQTVTPTGAGSRTLRRSRAPDRKRRWSANRATGDGYVLVPAAGDGKADTYGVGDFWALRYRSNQISDGAVATSTRAPWTALRTANRSKAPTSLSGTQPTSPMNPATKTLRAATTSSARPSSPSAGNAHPGYLGRIRSRDEMAHSVERQAAAVDSRTR